MLLQNSNRRYGVFDLYCLYSITPGIAFTTGISYFLMLAMIILSLLITIPLFSRAITDFYEENYGGGAEDVSAWKEVLLASGYIWPRADRHCVLAKILP